MGPDEVGVDNAHIRTRGSRWDRQPRREPVPLETKRPREIGACPLAPLIEVPKPLADPPVARSVVDDPALAGQPSRARRRNGRALEPEYLGYADLVQLTGVSERAWRRALQDPVDPLPRYPVGGRTLFKRGEWEAWMQRRRAVGAPELDAIVRGVLEGIRR